MTSRFDIAAQHLTDKYLAPVPSQFMNMPRAMKRCEPEDAFSVHGYVRALSDDCLAITGNIDRRLTE